MFPRTPHGEIDRDRLCRMLEDLLPAFAAGAASSDEARFVTAALPLCLDGAEALTQYYALLTLMPGTLPAPEGAPLPASALLKRIAHDDSHDAWAAGKAVRSLPMGRLAPTRSSSRPWGAYALVALALIAFGLSNAYWAWELSRVRSSTEQALLGQQQMIAQLQLTLTPAPPQVLTSQHRNLTPTVTLDGMQGIFIWSDDERVGTLYVSGMPPLESGRAYQLWLMRDAGTVAASLGVFTVDGQGAATLVFESAEPIASYSDIGISIEPLGGSTTPTTPNVAVANI